MRSGRVHVGAVTLARLDEGLISGRRATRIRRHLARCERCASVHDGLTTVAALLASTPLPTMPAPLVGRLTETLAAEASARTRYAPTTTGDGARVDLPPAGWAPRSRAVGGWRPRRPGTMRPIGSRVGDGPPHRGRGVSAGGGFRTGRRGAVVVRGLTAAAVVCLLAVVGLALSHLPAPHSTAAATSTKRHGVAAIRPTGARVRPYNLTPTVSTPSRSGVAARPFPVLASGTDFQPAELTRQAQADLDELLRARSGAATDLRFGIPTAALVGCVSRITGDRVPTLVDTARYRGRPATVIVLAGTGSRPGEVWVVNPSCMPLSRVDLPAASRSGR